MLFLFVYRLFWGCCGPCSFYSFFYCLLSFLGLPGAPRGFPALPGASRGFPGLPVASRGFLVLPGASRSSPGLPGASRAFPGLPRASRGFPELPGASWCFPGLPGASRDFLGLPGPSFLRQMGSVEALFLVNANNKYRVSFFRYITSKKVLPSAITPSLV